MRFTATVILGAMVGGFVLSGCQHQLSLEEAQALCTKQGGFLVIIYTQKLTLSGLGPPVGSPGNCVMASKFDMAQPASGTPATAAPAAPAAPGSSAAAH